MGPWALFAIAIVLNIVSFAITAMMMPKATPPEPATLAEFNFPQHEEDTPHAVLFGDAWTDGWQVLWYGNLWTTPIKAGGGGGQKKQTVGFRYLMTLFMGLCRGPINEMVEIEVGEKPLFPFDYDGYQDTPPTAEAAQQYTTYDEMVTNGAFVPVGSIAEVTADPDTTLNGVYIKFTNGLFYPYNPLSPVLNTSTEFELRAPFLFGGDDEEGGIQGPFFLRMGAPTQNASDFFPITPYVGDIGAMRGVVTCMFTGLIASGSPYPKPWRFRLRRSTEGWSDQTPWYPAKALILMNNGAVHAMNPAHMIYECLTNKEWGRGLHPNRLDENSFIRAANQLCSELFGLCFLWSRQDDLDQFIKVVIDHICGALDIDPATGLWTLRLIRDDYNPVELPLFDYNSGLISIDEDDNAAGDMVINEVVVKFRDPAARGLERARRVQNLAAHNSHGSVINHTVSYPGIPTAELADRVALRDLRTFSAAPKRYKLTLDRRAWRLMQAMPFRISVPSRGIESMVLRVLERGDAGHKDGKIEITACQDVFGLPDASYVALPAPPTYTPPSPVPSNAAAALMVEAGYRDLARIGDSVTGTDGKAMVAARRPASVQTSSYQLWSDNGAGFTQTDLEAWAPAGVLNGAVAPYDTTLTLQSVTDFPPVMTRALLIEGAGGAFEIAHVIGWNGVDTMTVERGCADTIPASHADGARVWLIDDAIALDAVNVDGVLIGGKVLTVAGGVLSLGAATTYSTTLDQRYHRPYPPGDVQANGLQALTITPSDALTFAGVDVDVTFAHRDRVAQGSSLVAHQAADVGPEGGTSYDLRIYDTDGTTLLRTISGSTSPLTYDTAMQSADSAGGHVFMELDSVRSGLGSMQTYRWRVDLVPASAILDENSTAILDEAGHPILDET